MHSKLEETVKVDVALQPVSLASTNATGPFFNLKQFRRALFLVTAAAIADTKTVVAQVMQATDGLGTGSKVITGATVTITSPAGAAEALLTAATIVDGDSTVTVNGTTFTCEDTDPDADAGEFASGANDTAAAANLATVINALLPDLVATADTGVVTLAARDPGETTITITAAHATIVPSITKVAAYIEVDETMLDDANDFTHVAIKATTDATIVVGADVIRGRGRFGATQQVAASLSSL